MKNKKMITVIAIATFIIIIYFGTENFMHETASMPFSYEIKGCAETDKGTASRAIGDEKDPSISVSGNSVLYNRAITHLCCRKAEMNYDANADTINIYEVWSGNGCRCVCFSEIDSEVKNVSKGKYIVNVYETGTDVPINETLLISEQIMIE